jgi:hypothetical protein
MDLLEGVEEIPGVVLADGLTWEWEGFSDLPLKSPTLFLHVQSPQRDRNLVRSEGIEENTLDDQSGNNRPGSRHSVLCSARTCDGRSGRRLRCHGDNAATDRNPLHVYRSYARNHMTMTSAIAPNTACTMVAFVSEQTGDDTTLYCGPVLRHPAELMLPAVDLGGRVWLGGKPCKGWPAAPAFGG